MAVEIEASEFGVKVTLSDESEHKGIVQAEDAVIALRRFLQREGLEGFDKERIEVFRVRSVGFADR